MSAEPAPAPDAPLRVGFVCHEYPPGPHGGIGTLVQTLARGLAARGHRVLSWACTRRRIPRPTSRTTGA